MEAPNRKILYRKEVIPEPAKKTAAAIKPVHPREGLVEWLAAHPLINISGLAKACGIDRGNLTRWIKAGKIPDKHEAKVEHVLQDYGYCQVVRTFKAKPYI